MLEIACGTAFIVPSFQKPVSAKKHLCSISEAGTSEYTALLDTRCQKGWYKEHLPNKF